MSVGGYIEELFTRKEAAEYLGGLSESTLSNWACTHKYTIPYTRVGRSVRYKKSDLDAFLKNGVVKFPEGANTNSQPDSVVYSAQSP